MAAAAPGPGRRPSVRAAAATLLSVLLAAPLLAQGPSQRGFDLSRGVSQSLAGLQERWLEWVDAFYRGDRGAAGRAVAELQGSVARLGMARLPDLSLAATARAVEAARQGDHARARWALADAESLDPGRAETAFGRAVVEWEAGRYHLAAGHQLVGYARLLDASPRGLVRLDLLLAAVAAVLLAGACFVLLQLASKGPQLYWAMHRRLSAAVPSAAAHALVFLLLLWPLALPAGPLWALLYWSVLLWGFGSVSERVVVATLWATLAAAPVLVASQQERVAAMLTPPARAIEALAQGRLYGGLFADLGVLPAMLPDSPAVPQLLGDLHRLIGQWDEARAHYERVIEHEPENVPALLDLGAFYSRKADHGNAVQLYQRAAAADPTSAAAYYNLSLSYSDAYQFNEQRDALARARSLDEAQVTQWIHEPRADRVVTYDGGIARREEILESLREATAAPSSEPVEAARRWLPFGLAALALVLAVVLARLLPHTETPPHPPGTGRAARLARLAVPGLPSAQAGNGGRAFAALLVIGVAVVLLGGARLLFPLPLGLAPGGAGPTVAALLALALLYGGRAWLELR